MNLNKITKITEDKSKQSN